MYPDTGGNGGQSWQSPTYPTYDIDQMRCHTRSLGKDKAEHELVVSIKKATSPDEIAPKQVHVRKCIAFTWDYHSSISFWSGLRLHPMLANEVQTFKALIVVHKVLQEGHPITIEEAHGQTDWLEMCALAVRTDESKEYVPLIRSYAQLILAKLNFHRLRPEFKGLFEYEEYVTLKGTENSREGYEAISDLMSLQDQIESFRSVIYRFVTSMLKSMLKRTDDMAALEPLRKRYARQHRILRKFYDECSKLKYLTGLINVPNLGHEPPELLDCGDVALQQIE